MLRMQLAGSLGNLGLLALCAGHPARSKELVVEGLAKVPEHAFVRLALLDSLANVALYEGDLGEAGRLIDDCAAIIATHTVPARSWYDLTHQITRCAFLSHQEAWATIIDVVNDADPELDRRQLRTWRASLLCAKARAHARLGDHDAADATLLTAMRACPRGAVDPLITLEATTGTCLALRGDTGLGQRHFDRALRACDAIDHRYQAWAVTRERASLPPHTRRASQSRAERHRHADSDDAALLLSDVAALLGAGHSIDLLAQRVVAILEATPLRTRMEVTKRSDQEYLANPVASWESRGTDGCRINLAGSDRQITIDIRDLHTLEEVSLVKSLTDVISAAVHQTSDADDDEHLWPRAHDVGSDDRIFWSPRMQELLRITQRLASTDLPILITGETGTGKEIVARLIHEHSKVRRGPFVPFNASALPRDLVESQLFGHRRGAFTGALESSPGVIRSAAHGTLFLDEIADLDPLVQPKLLRFLESGEVHPVGELRPIRVNVRVVSATNAHLESLVNEGRFRSDLFYRIRVASVALPPLRERKDEIPAFAALFVRKAAAETGRQHIVVNDDVIAALLLYDWPGNIRQLANELRRIVALADDGATLTSANLSPEISGPWLAARPRDDGAAGPAVTIRLDQPLDLAIADVERAFVERALQQTHGHVTDAAQLLGISRKGLFLKRKKLGIE